MPLTNQEKEAQIARLIACNEDESWSVKQRRSYSARIDAARGLAFRRALTRSDALDKYLKLVIGAIKMNNGVVKYDSQTLLEMQREVSGRQKESARRMQAKIDEARKRFGK